MIDVGRRPTSQFKTPARLSVVNMMPAMKQILLPLLVCVAMFGQASMAFADAFTVSGIATSIPRAGQDGSYTPYDLTGTMTVVETAGPYPFIQDMGDRYRIWYDITFDFAIGSTLNLSGAGYMVVDGNGCGLFDCNMAGVNAVDDLGRTYGWSVNNGRFFDESGTPYPSVFDGALPYAVMPNSFEISGWRFNGSGAAYDWGIGTLSATRLDEGAQAVPEPSTLALMGLGASGLLFRRRRKAIAG